MTGPLGRKLLRGLHRRLGGRALAAAEREPGLVNHVSLGSHCHMAQVLKTTGLRTWSGPFDWIFSSPGMVLDCLADDFSALLDPAQLESTPLAERQGPNITRCRHRLYGARHAIPFVFNHHDPATSIEDYRFLGAGVRRLRTALASPGAHNHFYLMTSLPAPEAVVLGLCDVLAQGVARNRLTFLQILPGGPVLRVRDAIEPRPNLRWLRLETPSASTGLRFAAPADDEALARIVLAEVGRGGGP